ncbi:cell wall-binding repeat-containing protein, partial [Stomatohabitans albus]
MSKKRSLALLGASSMLLSILPAAAFAQAPAAKTLEHLKLSADKVKDPVEISALWASKVGKAENVLVTTDAVFADSLASGALQGTMKAPLLFIDAKAGLDEQTVKTITSLGATKVTVLGGEEAISKSIAESLAKVAGVTEVSRVEGASRVETSIALAEKTKAKDDTVIIARSDDYADSLAAGALAARTGFPVVLVPQPYKVMKDGKEETINLHPAVEEYLKKAATKKVIVAGGPSAVADSTFTAIKNIVADTTRASGESRRETAVALAKLWNNTGKVTVVEGYSDVNGFHNGFAAALSAANLGAPVVLTNKAQTLSEAELALAGPAATGVTGYCGTYVNDALCKVVADKQGAAVKNVMLA